jgi:hypothetical protein
MAAQDKMSSNKEHFQDDNLYKKDKQEFELVGIKKESKD